MNPEIGTHNHKKSPILPANRQVHPSLYDRLSKLKWHFIDPESHQFLKSALTENPQLEAPKGMNPDLWIRNRNIFGTYLLSRASLKEIGQMHGISHEAIRDINYQVFKHIWNNSSQELKDQFPQVQVVKHIRFQPNEYRLLLDEIGSRIMADLEQDRSPKQLLKSCPDDLTRHHTYSALKMLSDLGFPLKNGIPYIASDNRKVLNQLSNPELSDSQVEALLNLVTPRGLAINQLDPISEQALKVPVRFAKSLGYHLSIREHPELIRTIQKAKIPLGHIQRENEDPSQEPIQNYYFFATFHQNRVALAYAANETLQPFLENPVIQVAGPDTNPPSTYQIARSDEIVSVIILARELGIKERGIEYQTLKDYLTEKSPVPIFNYQGNFYFSLNQKETLKAYLRS